MGWHQDKTTRLWYAAGKMVVWKQLSMNTLISLLLSSIATQLVRFFAGRLSFAQVVQLWRFWYIRGCARYQPHNCFLQQRVSVYYRATSRQDACLPCPGFCHGFHSLSKIITTGHHSFAILLVDLTLMTECTQQVCRVLCTHWHWQVLPKELWHLQTIQYCHLANFITRSGSMRNVHNVFSWQQRWVEGSLQAFLRPS